MIEHAKSTARLVLITFVLTFAAARILVYLIMARTLPDLFLFVGGTHVHHLNYGIFLLAGVGAVLLFARPTGRWLPPRPPPPESPSGRAAGRTATPRRTRPPPTRGRPS